MIERENVENVVRFFDTHPINEQQVLHDLKRDGIALEGLSEDVLQNYDQDHFGGLAATDVLAQKAGIDASTHVLDVCSGIGGPARYLANALGCRVTGIDLTRSRHESAVRLTRMVNLDQMVDFHHGNALDMPFADASFDVAISQEAFAHVPEKPRLIEECARVVKPGGRIAFTDVMRRSGLQASSLARLQDEMVAATPASLEEYRDLLGGAGCRVVSCEDLSSTWAEILAKRLEMYRSLGDTTVARFGEEHFRKWDDTYAFFVGLYAKGQLGGGRLVAQRNA